MVDVIIPTYKPDGKFDKLLEMLSRQSVTIQHIIIINTEVQPGDSRKQFEKYQNQYQNLEIYPISRDEFNHGRSRNFGASKSKAEICVFMTQDAVPENSHLIEKLLKAFENENVACAYGRQLPDENSTEIEKLTRAFNYPPEDRIKTREDIGQMGIKAFFCSNVCCAYRMEVFWRMGGFVDRTIFNEDMIYAGGIIQKGYAIAYVSDAEVIHSHNYSGKQQLKRNFDLGVSQAEHPEIFANISSEKEGIKMVKKIISLLRKSGHSNEIFSYIHQSACKFIGYRLGKAYKKLPYWLIMKCTMSASYFRK